MTADGRPHTIERLSRPAADRDLRELAELLVDAVESGAAVSFMAPLTIEGAEGWWRAILSNSNTAAIFLVARDGAGIASTVPIHQSWAPNQPHSARNGERTVATR